MAIVPSGALGARSRISGLGRTGRRRAPPVPAPPGAPMPLRPHLHLARCRRRSTRWGSADASVPPFRSHPAISCTTYAVTSMQTPVQYWSDARGHPLVPAFRTAGHRARPRGRAPRATRSRPLLEAGLPYRTRGDQDASRCELIQAGLAMAGSSNAATRPDPVPTPPGAGPADPRARAASRFLPLSPLPLRAARAPSWYLS